MTAQKGLSGTASIGGETVTFEFGKLIASMKKVGRIDFPISAIESVEYTPGGSFKNDRLRIRAAGIEFAHDPRYDPCTFEFGSKEAGRAFADSVMAAAGVEPERIPSNKDFPSVQTPKPSDGKLLAVFGGVTLFSNVIREGRKKWTASGSAATVESPTIVSRSTVTRVATGIVVGGAAGAIVGGMAKKNSGEGYLTITTTEGTLVVPFRPKDETKARKFAAKVNDLDR